MSSRPISIGLLTSVGQTLDAFFPAIVSHWKILGHEVHTAAGSDSTLFNTTVLQGVTRRPHPSNLLAHSALREWVTNKHLDVIVTNTATASALARLRPLGVPVVYFCHGLHWDNDRLANLPYRFIEHHLAMRTAGIITLNSDDDQWFARHADQIPRIRLPYGVGLDPAMYPRTPIQLAPIPRILWIGEFSRRKDPLAAVKVADALATAGTPFTLTMLGEGPLLADVRTAVSNRPWRRSAQLPGRVPATPFFNSANTIIHTSQWEGLPRALLESVSVGRPNYAFDVKGVRDIPGINLVPPRNYTSMADAIIYDHAKAGRIEHQIDAYPAPDELSYEHSANAILDFIFKYIVGSP